MHGLLFERFLNPERVSMPDFDIDFDERRRGEVIRYVTEKYGSDRVAQIVTYGTIKAKQAVKDASRVLGYPFGVGEKITKAMPAPVMGKDVPLAGIFDPEDKRYGEGAEFRALYAADPDVKTVVDSAKDLEGLKRQWGVHAAGVIMSSEPLIDIIPIMRREQDGAIITQFDYPTCEALGLIKMDFLGLRNLTVLDDALGEPAAQPRDRPGPGGAAAGRPGELRAARPGRHPRGLPAGRRTDAPAAAQHAPGQLRRHLRRAGPVPARADGGRSATTSTRGARPAGSRSPPSIRSWPSRWPTSWTRPTG